MCKVIFMSNPTVVLCCVEVGVLTIKLALSSPSSLTFSGFKLIFTRGWMGNEMRNQVFSFAEAEICLTTLYSLGNLKIVYQSVMKLTTSPVFRLKREFQLTLQFSFVVIVQPPCHIFTSLDLRI